jgi:hypothetical protein
MIQFYLINLLLLNYNSFVVSEININNINNINNNINSNINNINNNNINNNINSNINDRNSLNEQGVDYGPVTNYPLTYLTANGFVLCSSVGMNTMLTQAEISNCSYPGGM